jgi:hypothetical protein
MRCTALWYGGSSYSTPDPDRDLEHYRSMRAAREVFEARYAGDGGYTPCVSDDTEMHIYFGGYHENGPDRILRFGPRGGVILEHG